MSEYLEYGGLEEDAKSLQKKVWDFFSTDYQVLYDALHEVYEQGVSDTREKIAQEIEALKCNYELMEEECVIENAALQQAVDMVRNNK